MTKPHDLACYLDGWRQIMFCKVCSAEGEKLLEACPQKILDGNNQSTINNVIELRNTPLTFHKKDL